VGLGKGCGHKFRVVGWPQIDEIRIDDEVVVVIDEFVEGILVPGIEGRGKREIALLAAPIIDRVAGERDPAALRFNTAFMKVDDAEEWTRPAADFALDRTGIGNPCAIRRIRSLIQDLPPDAVQLSFEWY
jgi:hypothetical protein